MCTCSTRVRTLYRTVCGVPHRREQHSLVSQDPLGPCSGQVQVSDFGSGRVRRGHRRAVRAEPVLPGDREGQPLGTFQLLAYAAPTLWPTRSGPEPPCRCPGPLGRPPGAPAADRPAGPAPPFALRCTLPTFRRRPSGIFGVCPRLRRLRAAETFGRAGWEEPSDTFLPGWDPDSWEGDDAEGAQNFVGPGKGKPARERNAVAGKW